MPPISRNDPCPCGSGLRYKHCCGSGAASPRPAAAIPAPVALPPAMVGDLREPGNIEAAFALAMKLHQEGRLDQAAELYGRIVEVQPRHADALHYLGVCSYQHGRNEEAIDWIERALAVQPDTRMAYGNLGLAMQALHRNDEALACYDQAIQQNPADAIAHNNRGLLLQSLGHLDAALRDYAQALAIQPGFAAVFNNRGKVLAELGEHEKALSDIDQSISLNAGNAEAHGNRASLLVKLRRYEDALASYGRAIALQPANAEMYTKMGGAFWALGRYGEALASYDKAISLKPDDPKVIAARGGMYCDLSRFREALADYDKALTLDPGNADFLASRGDVLSNLKRYAESIASLKEAVSLEPDLPYLRGFYQFALKLACQWDALETDDRRIIEGIEGGHAVCNPFQFLATRASPDLQQRCARIWIQDRFPNDQGERWEGKRYAHDRIRIGYFSSDLRNHPVAHLISELIERHDRSGFEVVGFSLGTPAPHDPWRQRLERAFDRFVEVGHLADAEIVDLARGMEIDIAIDLNGITRHARTGIFAVRPAPVSVNYLGYPATMGARFMDYILADATVIPALHDRHYTEKVVRLPHCFQVNDSTKVIGETRQTRGDLGLPGEGFVFCCFNKSYKITPDVFDIWMNLLNRVAGSVLWLYVDDVHVENNLRSEAAKRGVSPDRLVFADRVDPAEYLSRYRHAGLFLDTLYYNAGTTASDALWTGLPVLTCLGETFAGRMAASLLKAVGLPELITHSHEEYEALAFTLATEPERLAGIRRKLAENRLAHPLFDTALFARHIEAAYRAMHQRHQAGLPPDHIAVAA